MADDAIAQGVEATIKDIKSPAGKNTEKTYGYLYDSTHEASIEARLIEQIKVLGQVNGNKCPSYIEGNLQALISEIQGFLHKWNVRDSYVERAGQYIGNQKSVNLFIVQCLYRDFMRQADRLGFKNATNIQEDWEKRFLGLSK